MCMFRCFVYMCTMHKTWWCTIDAQHDYWLGIWLNLISAMQIRKDFSFVTSLFCSNSVQLFAFKLVIQNANEKKPHVHEVCECVFIHDVKISNDWHHAWTVAEIVCCINQKGSFCLCFTHYTCFCVAKILHSFLWDLMNGNWLFHSNTNIHPN